MLRSQYHRRREGRGDQRREGFRDTYMCPWYSVDVVTKPSGAAQDLAMVSSTGTPKITHELAFSSCMVKAWRSRH